MQKVRFSLAAMLLSGILFYACNQKVPDFPVQEKVWVPIYSPKEDIQQIKTLDPQDIRTGGKVYVYNQYLLQVEPNTGIHVFEFVDKVPKPLSFIQVYGAQEISIRANVLYTNNYTDLISLDISNPKDVKVISRIDNTFQAGAGGLPPEPGFFQCIDPTKGIVTGWELKQDIQANCKY